MTGQPHLAELPFGPGRIGITAAPGLRPAGHGGQPGRDLLADLDAVAVWRAAAVVTLMERRELDELGIAALGAEVRRRLMDWHHWPIRDYGVPDAGFEAKWPHGAVTIRRVLSSGGRVLIHCRGGLGRSGTIAARLLVEDGTPAEAAIAQVRAVRPRAIETPQQEAWVRAGRSTPLLP